MYQPVQGNGSVKISLVFWSPDPHHGLLLLVEFSGFSTAIPQHKIYLENYLFHIYLNHVILTLSRTILLGNGDMDEDRF